MRLTRELSKGDLKHIEEGGKEKAESERLS